MLKHLVIPARLKSTRLPNKPLLEIHGKPMILWVIDRANAVKSAGVADDIFVATDDDSIAKLCQDYGANVILTDPNHASGTDRLAEVARLQQWSTEDIVINMQGDEPLVPAGLIKQVTELLLQKKDCVMATLAEPIQSVEEFLRPSVVKVVKNAHKEALYFSRAPIPCDRHTALLTDQPKIDENSAPKNAYRHLGIYAYRVNLLQQFSVWQQGELEQLESLEQLRILEQGMRIAIDIASELLPPGVDTQEDLDRLNELALSELLK